MKKIAFLLLVVATCTFHAQENESTKYLLNGTVVDTNQQPVENAFVRIKDSFSEVSTNEKGEFTIEVDGESELVINAMFIYRKIVPVGFERQLDIVVTPKYEPLGEVNIRQKKKKFEKKSVIGGSGIRRALGYDGDRFRETFVDESDFDLFTSLAKIPNLQLRVDVNNRFIQQTGMGSYLMITKNGYMTPVNIILDDMLVPASYLLGYRAHEIENVMLVDDQSFGIVYGVTFGGYPGHKGFLIIDTIYGRMGDWDEGPPSMLAKDNDYENDATALTSVLTKPDYILELEKATDFEQAKAIHQKQLRAMAFTSLPYMLNTADFFRKWNQRYATGILNELYEIGKSNPRVLLGLAYHYEEMGELGKATYVYQDVITLMPDDIQSYRNLALMYAQTGKFELANTLYKKMLFNEVPNVDFSPLAEIIRNEYKNLIAHHKPRIDYSGLPSDMLNADFKKDMRMVFEWSDPFVEFELQMVSPEGKFYTWKHSQEVDPELLSLEVENGFAIKEFIIDDAEQGEWLVNINVLNSENEMIPAYLKYTFYSNYGKETETQRMKVVNLNQLNAKVTLDNVLQEKSSESLTVREKPSSILLYWDTSLGLKNRKLKSELRLLSDYLASLTTGGKTVNVNLILFGRDLKEQKEFIIDASNFSMLESAIRNVRYHGPTDFSGVLDETELQADAAFVFSDATSIYSMPATKLNMPIFSVNSLPDANHMILNDLAFYSGGFYVDLSRKSVEVGLKNLIQDVYVNADYASLKEMNQTDNLVYGVVYNESGPIQGATVGIKATFNQVNTASNGMYRIAASKGDILQVNAFGMKTKDTIVGDIRKIHIGVKPDGELLDEVTVTGKKSESEMVDTPFESKKKGSVGYSLANRILSDQIGAYQTDLFQVLQKMPGVIVEGQTSGNPKFKLRRTQNNSLRLDNYPAFVLNGMIIDQASQQVPQVNPQQIKSITILQSANAAIRYGQLAANGAIVIETFTADDIADSLTEDTLDPVKGNEYTELVQSLEDQLTSASAPEHVQKILQAPDAEAAKSEYHKALEMQSPISVGFFTQSAKAMTTHDREYAATILFNISEIAPKNKKALKTLAYHLEQLDMDARATPVYERLINLYPASVQSYLDLARNYKAIESFELATTLYKQMLSNSIPKVDFSEVGETVINELKQLVSLHKSRIDYSNLSPAFLKVGFKQDIRIVLEWNDPLADFELQFVNPDKKYFQLSHSVFGNKAQIQKEIEQGFSIMEFAIDDADPGQWLVNLEYRGNQDPLNPVVLKYTKYTNFGLPNEEREIKTVKLQDLSSKVILDSFIY